MQEILWNGKKALLIQVGDITRDGEREFREYIEEHRDIERLVFTMNPMFIPKDIRDIITHQKLVTITKVPERKPPTTKPCPHCFGSGKIQSVFRDFGGERFICEADFDDCERCGGTGKIPITKKKMMNKNDRWKNMPKV